MNKSNKIFLVLIIILLVALIVMTALYFNMRNTAKENLNHILETAEENSKLNQKISELEEKINIRTITNTTNMTMPNNNVVPIQNSVSQNEIPEERDYSIDTDKVSIAIDKNTITNESVSIVITNDNENEISYGEEFKIQNKINGEWKDLEYLPNTVWKSIGLITKGNSQTTKKLNIEYSYGALKKGVYRVVKPVFNGKGGTVDICSDEFEIE